MASSTTDTKPSPILSALTTHLTTHLPRRPPPAPQTTAHHALALQLHHNLQHQHLWTALTLHTHSPLPPYAPLPRPLLSGLPPRRLYVHPDEQVELLKSREEPEAQREWVVPSHLREKWSLRRLGEVFDAVPEVGGERWGDEKRVVLGIVEDDGTAVYYLVHDGVVKPRQN